MPRIGAALLCGAAAALCYPKPGLCLLAWFVFAPLFSLWRESDDAGRLGFAAGFAFHGTALYWVFSTCRFAGVNILVCALAWASLASFMAINWGIIGLLGRRLKLKSPFAWAALWTAVTYATEHWTPRLCADILGYTQYRFLSLLQISSLAGPHFLGFLIIAFNAALAEAWEELDAGQKPPARDLALCLGALAAVLTYGKASLLQRSLRAPGPTARIEILQPDIDQYRKWDARFEREILDGFSELLSRPRAAAPDLIVWPESSIPMIVGRQGDIPVASEWGRKLKAAQIVGVASQDAAGLHSSAFLLDDAGAVAGTYDKRQLVPFGEFIPFPWLRRFIGILNELGGMTPGERAQPLLRTPLGVTAASVCYEAVFPRWARFDAFRGARVLVNVTNDGWYKDTWGPYQHFRTNMFRAIENRATVVRAGNTGISGVIDPWGVVTAQLALGERGRLDADVPRETPFPRGSFYSRHGDWFGRLCIGASMLLALA